MAGISRKLSRKLLCLAVASVGAGSAFAGPAGPVVSAGSASYNPATLTLTSTSARTQISWQSFNVGAGELVNFVQPNAHSSVLNHVFNPRALNILGGVSSNGSVLFMSDGRVYGAGVNLDLAGAISTSLRLPRMALALSGAPAAQPRPLTTLADGRIYVLSQDEQAVTGANGDLLLNPGKTVELANAAMPNLRVELTAPKSEAVNLSRLVGSKGDTGIFAGVFRVPAAARQALERDGDAQLTAAAQERTTFPDLERFYRYALLYARLRSETAQDEGGMMKVAAVSSGRVLLPAASSRPSVLPQAIEIGARADRSGETAVALPSLPLAAAPEPVATLEPQPIPAAGESEAERNRATLLALAPARPAAELVATLEPQPIPAAGENEAERNHVTLVALAPARPAVEVVATLEPQPILLRQSPEPEDIRMLAQGPDLGGDRGQGGKERKAAAAVIVVALAQHSARPVPEENSNVKEVRVERRAPRYFTDHRGAMFFM